MKYLITLLSMLIAAGAWADNRLELGNANGGHHCHTQWNQDNADDEFKHSCTVNLEQDGDSGTYSGQANGAFLKEKSTIKAPLPNGQVFDVSFSSNCSQTAGTIQDDNGNAFTTGDCDATVSIKSNPKMKPDVLVTYRLVLRNAVAAAGANALKSGEAADEAGESVMFREGMGYK